MVVEKTTQLKGGYPGLLHLKKKKSGAKKKKGLILNIEKQKRQCE